MHVPSQVFLRGKCLTNSFDYCMAVSSEIDARGYPVADPGGGATGVASPFGRHPCLQVNRLHNVCKI